MEKLLLIFMMLLVGCSSETKKEVTPKEPDIFQWGIHTIEHEGCEYVIFKDEGRSDVAMLHKQNCKYCNARNTVKK